MNYYMSVCITDLICALRTTRRLQGRPRPGLRRKREQKPRPDLLRGLHMFLYPCNCITTTQQYLCCVDPVSPRWYFLRLTVHHPFCSSPRCCFFFFLFLGVFLKIRTQPLVIGYLFGYKCVDSFSFWIIFVEQKTAKVYLFFLSVFVW